MTLTKLLWVPNFVPYWNHLKSFLKFLVISHTKQVMCLVKVDRTKHHNFESALDNSVCSKVWELVTDTNFGCIDLKLVLEY
jgi:hypothetical protein